MLPHLPRWWLSGSRSYEKHAVGEKKLLCPISLQETVKQGLLFFLSWFQLNWMWALLALLHRRQVKNNSEKNHYSLWHIQSSCGKLVRRRSYSHPSSSVCPAWWSLLAPRGGLASTGHTLGAGICSAGWLPGRVQIYFCLLRRILGLLHLERNVSYTYKGVQKFIRNCQGTTRKCYSLSVLMSPAHKRTYHLHCVGTGKLITMCIKNKVAGRMYKWHAFPPSRKCYYVHIIPSLVGIFNV